MKRRTPVQRPTAPAAPRLAPVPAQLPAVTARGGLAGLIERVQHEIFTATYWFDPAPHQNGQTVSVRFSGNRLGVTGVRQRGDRFSQDETIDRVVAGSGPISITTRVSGVNPGEWGANANMLGRTRDYAGSGGRMKIATEAQPLYPAAWSWRQRALSRGPTIPIHTGLMPFARIPGVILGFWAAMVTLGMLVGLATEAWLSGREGLLTGDVLRVTMVAILSGAVGGKVWFVILRHRLEGWCVQAFVVGAALAAIASLAAVGSIPLGTFLDVTTPGLFFGMAVGRVGCFYAGCCGGRPTASRWGVWSSDQRVGARRIPTQFMESALALSVGLAALGSILISELGGGAVFVAANAAYTLCRQAILRLRAEASKSMLGGAFTAAVAAVALLGAILVRVLSAA